MQVPLSRALLLAVALVGFAVEIGIACYCLLAEIGPFAVRTSESVLLSS